MHQRFRLILLASLASVAPLPVVAKEFAERKATQYAPVVEWQLRADCGGNPFDVVARATFVHEASGERRTTEMFHDGGRVWKFRCSGVRTGGWTFTTESDNADLNGHRGSVLVEPAPGTYGFVSHVGNRWVRQVAGSDDPEAFVPQFVMYAGPHGFAGKPEMIDRDIRTFLVEHGFTGFHVPVQCRWFDLERPASSQFKTDDPNPDPRTFAALELLITKVHAAGGTVHLWAWGDESRRQTPARWGLNGKADRRLQRYIAARLGPLPGWTMGYGFDLWEWVNGEQLDAWHRNLQQHFGWQHLLGGRAHKNRLTQISESLDYAAYEQHRPDYAMYVRTISARPEKPAFSEDRFRVRQSKQYADKDYDYEMTRRGLWHSTMAGGVANIWGNLQGNLQINSGAGASLPYPEPAAIKTWSVFFHDRGRFTLDAVRDNELTDGVCLRRPDKRHYVFYKEACAAVDVDLSGMDGAHPAVAVDAARPYAEVDLGTLAPKRQTVRLPRRSDWAIAVGRFAARKR